MMFPDDIELSRQNHRELEEDLEIWRNALERRGLKVSRSKAEYLIVGSTDIGDSKADSGGDPGVKSPQIF